MPGKSRQGGNACDCTAKAPWKYCTVRALWHISSYIWFWTCNCKLIVIGHFLNICRSVVAMLSLARCIWHICMGRITIQWSLVQVMILHRTGDDMNQWWPSWVTLQWRHNGHDGVSIHQPHDCILNRLFRRWSKTTSKPRVTGLCEGNSPVTGEFPAQRASYAENVSIWWRHHDTRPQWVKP